MKNSFVAAALSACALLPAWNAANAQVNVQMVFMPREIVMPVDTLAGIWDMNIRGWRNDTCGVRTGAGFYQDLDWPRGGPGSYFDCLWITSDAIGISADSLGGNGSGTYSDMRPQPANIPPFIVDYELAFTLKSANVDTFLLSWNFLPPEIDSIAIDDITPGGDSVVFGRFIHKFISHSTQLPDTVRWRNPSLVDIENLRVRVFYNKSVVNSSGVEAGTLQPAAAALRAYPNPANDVLYAVLPGAATGRIVLSDMLGRQIRAARIGGGWSERIALPLAGVPAGEYILALYSGRSVSTARVAIVK